MAANAAAAGAGRGDRVGTPRSWARRRLAGERVAGHHPAGHWIDVGLDIATSVLDHLLDRLGEDRVGLGSDFDGATVPADMGDVAGLPAFLDALMAHGYGETLVRKIACDNWLALLNRVWGG